MKFRRIAAVIAVIGAGSLALAGCTSTSGTGETSEIQKGTSVTAAQNSATFALNSYTTDNYTTYNSNVQYLTQSTFNYYDADQKLVKNTDLGTYKSTTSTSTSSPLTVKYTLKKGVTWSDGQPITATDILLDWASYLTKYNDAKGVNFNGIGQGSGLDYVTQMPKISDGGRSITFVFSKPYVDWEVAGIQPNIPAHVLWQEAFPDQKVSATKAAADVRTAIEDDDTTSLKALATAFNTKWNLTSMPTDKKLLVSSGAYVVSSFVENQYITLTARKNYKNGPAPKIAKFTMRFITDPTAQVQALQNGEISLLYGQATSDTVKALKGVTGVTSTTSPEASYEHIDLRLGNDGPFSPKSYGGDAAKALLVRQAFMKVIPRQEMLDRIIKPLSSTAKLDDSQLFLPGGDGYDGAVKLGDYANYQTVDVAGAKADLKKAGVSGTVKVRFAYPTDNPRRVQEFQLVQASAKAAGFDVVAAGIPTAKYFTSDGIAGKTFPYDASVFAYVLSSLSVGSSQGNTTCDNAYNYNEYCNKDVDSLWQQAVQAADFKSAIPYMQQIDAHVINDAASISLYQLPDVSAWDTKLQNVKNAPLTPNIFWNYFDWSIKK